jgi:nucleoside-diphosphate-sugar epimerase
LNILIFGISSFLGFNIANYLQSKNFRITGTFSRNLKYKGIKKLRIKQLSKKEIPLLKCNLNQKKEINKVILEVKPDIVINCAGYTKNYSNINFNKRKGYLNNIRPIKFIIDCLNKINPIVYFHIGSAWEYSQKIKICRENSTRKPEIPYGLQKLYGTNILKKLSLNFTGKIIVLRVFNFFGDLDNNQKLFPYLINNLKKNKISILSSGEQKRDYIHVFDLAKAITQIIKKKRNLKKFQIFNISRGSAVSIKFLAKKICKVLNKNFDLIKFNKKNNRSFENKIFFGENSKITNLIKWRSATYKKSLNLITSAKYL